MMNIIKIINETIVNLIENPDKVILPFNKIIRYYDSDALAFMYVDNVLFCGFIKTHDDIIKIGLYNGKIIIPDGIKKQIDDTFYEWGGQRSYDQIKQTVIDTYADHIRHSDRIKYDGRLWMDSKIISFWKYPENKTILYKILSDIEKQKNIKIINNGYKIEVINNKSNENDLIPIENYFEENHADLDNKPHELSPLQWQELGGKKRIPHNTIYHNLKKEKGTLSKSAAEYDFKTKKGIAENEDYRGEHQAPNKDDSPMYDVTNAYGNDFYDSLEKSVRYYGDGTNYDYYSVYLIQNVHNKPNALVKIYRAVPLVITNQEKIELYEKHKKHILKTGKLPSDVKNWRNKSEYYDFISDEIDKLKSLPLDGKTKINSGDWVTINPQYAKEHGIAHLNNKYRVLTKTVFAKNLFTDGNSIHEWGYVK